MTPHVLAVVEQFWHRMPGGTATATEHVLARLTAAESVEVTGLAARHSAPVAWPGEAGPGAIDGRQPWSRMPAGSTLRFHSLPRPLLYEAWLRLGLPSVDAHCRDGSVVWAASLIVPPTSAPVVATVHDLDFLANPGYSSRRGRSFFPLMWQRAVERTDLFVCPSQTVADDCAAQGVPTERLTVVPWGVAPPPCGPIEAAAILAGMDLPERYVLWVGPLTPRKNPKGAALAMAKVDADLVVVGHGDPEPEAAAALAALGPRLHRLAGVDDRTLSALYTGATAFLYPSLAEGFGLPILEAMAHGTPVVTSVGTATAEVAGGAALLADPTDVDDMAAAIEAAVFDDETRRRLIHDGLIRSGQLTWDATAKGYAEAFRSVR